MEPLWSPGGHNPEATGGRSSGRLNRWKGGSVRSPLDGDTRAAWALYKNWLYRLSRTEYDLEGAAAQIRTFDEWAEPIVRRNERASD
jgi:hypothetical protein